MAAATDFDPERFLSAQEGVFEAALAELGGGRKRSHWMWFIFPQLRGLGRSPAASYYGLAGLGEAVAFAGHPVLGPRLERSVAAALSGPERRLSRLFGSPDDLKFVSCMTLFEAADPAGPYRDARAAFGAPPDPETLRRITSRQE